MLEGIVTGVVVTLFCALYHAQKKQSKKLSSGAAVAILGLAVLVFGGFVVYVALK